ncbi:bidirectional sugar transporter SWEET7-like isoform X1 [Ipomoea triloba]|uniref:bidirectional sugar transporter SWEET7-like isoform X1 n=1 Tax=Ipomoea triloba TaxID=35885 RepID=UPI00125CF914|nr:bidirectional sugar transporter SWEET7-like isoform X1 [Ipomoea triloba]
MFSMNTTRTIVGIIGNLASVFLRISPLPTIVQIWKKKSVEQYSAAPYLATFLNCGLWVFYGTPIVHPNSLLLLTVNGLGVVITIVYLFVFLYCSDRNNRFKVALIVLAEVVFMAAHAILVLTLAHNWKLRSAIVGSTAGVCNILVYASPLAIMKLVITTKSVEYMPFSISLCSFVTGVCWTVYAFLPIDPYILAPNGIGALAGLAQLVLYAKYYKSNKSLDENSQVDIEVGKSEFGLTTHAKKPSSEA